MQLQVKKADSVTSILLFLFNVFLVEAGKWELPVQKILRLLAPFQKSETAVRMGLSRGVRNGLLVNFRRDGEVSYRLTPAARASFEYWWKVQKRFEERLPKQRGKWERHWTLVALRGDSLEIVGSQLIQAGFGALNKYLWVSPYPLSSGILTDVKLPHDAFVFQSTLTEGEKIDALVDELWQIERINKKYADYCKALSEAIAALAPSDNEGEALTLLHLFGLKLFEIIQEDPQLPLELLPDDWKGLEAGRQFREFRQACLPGAMAYVEGIINE